MIIIINNNNQIAWQNSLSLSLSLCVCARARLRTERELWWNTWHSQWCWRRRASAACVYFGVPLFLTLSDSLLLASTGAFGVYAVSNLSVIEFGNVIKMFALTFDIQYGTYLCFGNFVTTASTMRLTTSSTLGRARRICLVMFSRKHSKYSSP